MRYMNRSRFTFVTVTTKKQEIPIMRFTSIICAVCAAAVCTTVQSPENEKRETALSASGFPRR